MSQPAQALPSELTGARVHLRTYRPADSGMFLRMLLDNAEHLRDFLPDFLADVHDEAEISRWIARQQAEWDARELFIFGIWEKHSGAYLGECYLANPDWEVPRIELGYFLVKSAAGQGYASEAARAVIQFAFEHLKVLRLDLQCKADNLASSRLAQRCGFQLEGRFRHYQRKKDGSLVDVLWHGLLRSEWQP